MDLQVNTSESEPVSLIYGSRSEENECICKKYLLFKNPQNRTLGNKIDENVFGG